MVGLTAESTKEYKDNGRDLLSHGADCNNLDSKGQNHLDRIASTPYDHHILLSQVQIECFESLLGELQDMAPECNIRVHRGLELGYPI